MTAVRILGGLACFVVLLVAGIVAGTFLDDVDDEEEQP